MADYENNMARTRAGTHVGVRDIDEGLRAYMLRVYNYMALGLAFTALVTFFMMSQPALMQSLALGPGKWILFIAILGLGFMAPRFMLSGNVVAAHAGFWVYAALWGVLISPMIAYFFQAGNPGIIIKALAITAATFGATSLYGYVTKKDLSGFGTFLMMATIGLLIAIVVNAIFFQDIGASLVISCLVVLVFSAITAWETQAIKQMYVSGDAGNVETGKAIFGAFMLYGSFITIFIHLLNILGIMNQD